MSVSKLIGVDTSVLVVHSLLDHPDHDSADLLVRKCVDGGSLLAICPLVINEFIHVVTDSRRFERPLDMKMAISLARTWCESKETVLLNPSEQSVQLQLDWLQRYRLGRKRLHDTQIAATYSLAGVEVILSSNWRDFTVFECFEVRSLG